jgi:hypothetical protein
VVDDLDDGRVPVLALAVVEDAVAADHEVVRVAASEGRGDEHLLGAAAPRAAAVGQVGLAEGGQGGVGVGALDAHAEFAGPAVQVQGAGLEDGLAFLAVEVAEGHEIVEQDQEVAGAVHEADDAFEALDLLGQAQVLLQDLGQPVTGVAGQKGAHPVAAQGFDLDSGLGRLPRLVGRQEGLDPFPAGGVQALGFAEQGGDDHGPEILQGGGPGRVHAAAQRQVPAGLDVGQGQATEFGVGRQVPQGQALAGGQGRAKGLTCLVV